MTGAGFPHSEIFGSKRACRSPKLIAACCVLRRLMKPRHPSIAVTGLCKRSTILGVYLTYSLSIYLNFQRTKLNDRSPAFLTKSPREMVGPDGLEPSTPRLSSACSNQLSYEPMVKVLRARRLGGADRIRTGDPLLAKQVLYQLSYDPLRSLSALYGKEQRENYFVRSTETQNRFILR